MQAIMESASFADGSVTVDLSTSTMSGYVNNCQQYNDYGHISVPNETQLVNIDNQSPSNVVVTGYANRITDTNFNIVAGESANYSNSWYHIRANNGVFIQQANTTNKENVMMGNSTNHILLDMANLLVSIITYLQTIETVFNSHTHSGVQSGSSSTGTTSAPFITPPSDSDVNGDISKVTNGTNLAGNNYSPYPI